jgi:hypothetical protein
MAATVLGTALTFGVPTISGLVVQSINFRESVNEAKVPDEDGDVVSVALYGREVTGTVEAVDNTFTTAIGTAITITGAPTGAFYLTEKSQARSSTGFFRRTVGVKSWAGVS